MRKFYPLYQDSIIPTRATERSAGYDLYANESVIIQPNWWALVKTGVAVELNDDEELQVRPRSGLALKVGLTVLNSPGTIDADYFPNEIGVILHNNSSQDIIIKKDDKIAQGVFSKYLTTDDEEKITTQRTGGYGSTDDKH